MMKPIIRLLLVVSVAAGFLSAASAAHWNMATPYPDASFHTQNDYQFVKDIEQATDLDITIHSGGSLIKHPQIKRAVQTGQVQMGEVFISILGNQNPIFSLDSLPFLATSYSDARKLWKASKAKVSGLLAKDGIKLLYAVPWPPQSLYVSKPVNSVKDLKGLKYRANNAITAKLAKLLGMVPTQVEVPEVPQAFSTGIVDAMITSPTTGVTTKAWDYVDYFYNIQAWIPKNMVMVNAQAFEALPQKAQQAILKAAQAAAERGWQMSKKEAEAQKKVLKEHGIKVLQPSDELMSGLRKAGEKLTQEWLQEAGKSGQTIIDEYRSE